MIDDRLINRISHLMKDLSPRQKIILNQIIESKSFKIQITGLLLEIIKIS